MRSMLFVLLVSLWAHPGFTAGRSWSEELDNIYDECHDIWEEFYYMDLVADNIPPNIGLSKDDLVSWELRPSSYAEGLVWKSFDSDGRVRAELHKDGSITYSQIVKKDPNAKADELFPYLFDDEEIIEIDKNVLTDSERAVYESKDIFSLDWKYYKITETLKKIKFAREEERKQLLKKWNDLLEAPYKEMGKLDDLDEEFWDFAKNSPKVQDINEWWGGKAPASVLKRFFVKEKKIPEGALLDRFLLDPEEDPERDDIEELQKDWFYSDLSSIINYAAKLQKVSQEKALPAGDCGKNLIGQ